MLALCQLLQLVVGQLDDRRTPPAQRCQRVTQRVEIPHHAIDPAPARVALVVGEVIPWTSQVGIATRRRIVRQVLLVDCSRQLLAGACIDRGDGARSFEEGEDLQVAAPSRCVAVDQRAEARLGACAHDDRSRGDAELTLRDDPNL